MKYIFIIISTILVFGCINVEFPQNNNQNQTLNNTSIIQNNDIDGSSPLVLSYTSPNCPENYVRYSLHIKNNSQNYISASVDLFKSSDRIYSSYTESGIFDVCLNRNINGIISPIAQNQEYRSNQIGPASIAVNQNTYSINIENLYLEK